MKSWTQFNWKRPFLPLYAKILLFFALNVFLIGLVAWWLLRTHFGVDQSWLLSDAARERLHAMSSVLAAELHTASPDQWWPMVERTGDAHRVKLALVDARGTQLGGHELSLPPVVRERLSLTRRGMPAEGGSFWRQGERGRRGEGRALPGTPGGLSSTGTGASPTFEFHKEALRTTDPSGYWFLVRLPVPQRPPLVLVGMTETLGGTGLLFDPKPWLWAGVGVIGVSLLLWVPFARGLTRSIAQVTRATEEIARGDFHTRVNDRRRDELGQLGAAINSMTTRLDGFVTGQKRFMGDVAHELCSPLVRMEMALGILEQRIQQTDQIRLQDVQEEVERMRSLVSELLDFSRAGLGEPGVEREHVGLRSLLRDVVTREAESARVVLQVPPDLALKVPPRYLERALANLVRNAVQHGGDQASIEIAAVADGERVTITVSDHGPGVPEEALPQLFDPFFRVDPSRTRSTGGVGLGLAIVRSCVAMCEGEISAANQPGGGLIVKICLPQQAGS